MDGIGGFSAYAIIEEHKIAKQNNFIPIALINGATVVKDISKGSLITFDQVKLKKTALLSLYEMQEKLGLN